MLQGEGASLLPEGSIAFNVDGSKITNDKDLLTEISIVCKFPDYFGNNWNAMEDCLIDLEWLPAAGYQLIWRNASKLFLSSPEDFLVFLDICKSASEFWQKQGKQFQLVIADDFIFETANSLYGKVSIISPNPKPT